MIRLVIAEDHHLVRQGIRVLLEREEDIKVVGEAVDGREAVELVQRLTPDVLLMDIAMPRLDGIQALEKLRALNIATQTVILSMYSDDALVRQALHNGARGYLLKGSVSEELLLAIRAADKGAAYLSPAVSGAILSDPSSSQTNSKTSGFPDLLTAREREVLRLISEGHTNVQMAKLMRISVKTVERHRTHLMSKLNAHNLVELIRTAIKHGLIHLDN